MEFTDPSMRVTIAALAAWRLTHLLSTEDGPGDAIFRLRNWLGASALGRAMDCFHCLSLWISALLALAVTRHVGEWVLVWLALSGAACLLERFTQASNAVQYVPEPGAGHGMLRSEESGSHSGAGV
jgi:hypothetical protein